MRIARRLLAGQRGLTLLELTVVAAILGVLAALTAVAVTGQTTASKGAALATDKAEVQKAVQNFAGTHPKGLYPTLDGCLPGQTKATSGACQTGSAEAFDKTKETTWVAIIWDKGFKDSDGNLKQFVPNFVAAAPSHATEHTNGTDWPTQTVADPDSVVTAGLRKPLHAGANDTGTFTVAPVWALDKNGTVQVLISSSEY